MATDYEALARQFGGRVVTPSAPPPGVDYEALARQFGGQILSAPTAAPRDLTSEELIAQIPGQDGRPVMPMQPEAPLTMREKVMGAIETPAAIVATMAGAPISYFSGIAGPTVQEVVSGAITYQPRSRMAQEAVAQMGKFFEATKAPPYMPALAPPGMRNVAQSAPAVPRAMGQVVQPLAQGAELLKEQITAPGAARKSAAAFERGPEIDAASVAQRLGLAVPPSAIDPSLTVRGQQAIAGARLPAQLAKQNEKQVRILALHEMGLPENTQLSRPPIKGVIDPFDKAMRQTDAPYDQIKKLPIQLADDSLRKRLEAIRVDLDVIGAREYAPAVSRLVDDALAKTETGLNGEQLLKNISVLRERANRIFQNKNADIESKDIAFTNLKIANELESMIDNSIFNPNLLAEFQQARTKRAQIHAYRAATDRNTGKIDALNLAEQTTKDTHLTGSLEAIGRVAGNFPEAFQRPSFRSTVFPTITRTGLSAATGSAIGGALAGGEGYILGGVAGGATGLLGSELLARRLARPQYQFGLRLYDPRIRVPEAPQPPMAPIPQERAVVPYQTPQELLMPGQGPYNPNFIFVNPPEVTPSAPMGGPRALPAPSAQATLNALRAEDVRRNAMSRALGQEAEAAARAAEAAAPRQPAGAGTLFELDPTTGRLRPVDQGVKGATPETFSNYGAALESATNKLAGGQKFAFTAEERIAWNKTKADIAEIDPRLNKLSDKAIAEKMMDREWVSRSIQKARDQAAAFEQIAARAKQTQARQNALAQRERMMDLAEQLNESLRAPRPVASGQQGPKTRAAKRNALAPDQDNNFLAP